MKELGKGGEYLSFRKTHIELRIDEPREEIPDFAEAKATICTNWPSLDKVT